MEIEISSPKKPTTQKSLQEKWQERRKRRRLILEDEISQNLLTTANEEMGCTFSHQEEASSTHQLKLNLFREQLQLAKVDVFDNKQTKKQTWNLQLTHGFVKWEELSQSDVISSHNAFTTASPLRCKTPELEDFAISESENKEIQIGGTNTQFGITESELLRFCNEAESNNALKNTIIEKSHQSTIIESILNDFCKSPSYSPENTDSREYKKKCVKTPQQVNKSKSIVEQIMEDFCESPLSSKVFYTTTETPELRVKRDKARRTYTRHRQCASLRKLREEIAADTAKTKTNTSLTDDECLSDSSSGLSIQEDLTQQQQVALPLMELNTSQNIRNNLMNLSAFYSRVNSEDSELNNQTLTPSTHKRNSTNSPDLFQTMSEVVGLSHLQTTEDNNCDIKLIEHSCDSLEVLNENDAKYDNMWDDNDNDLFLNAFKTEQVLGNDCNELLTQSTPSIQKANVDTENEITNEKYKNMFPGFKTAAMKDIKISDVAHKRARCILESLPDLKIEAELSVENESNNEQSVSNYSKKHRTEFHESSYIIHLEKAVNGDIMNKISEQGCSCFSTKIETNSKSSTSNFARDANQLEIKTTELEEKIETENNFEGIQLSEWFVNEDIQNENTAVAETEFVGFTTASKKSIPVSTEAQVKVANIFNKLPDLTLKSKKENTADMKMQTEEISAAEMVVEKELDNLIAKDLNSNDQYGFYTASRKFIKVSTKAKASVEKIFDKLPELHDNTVQDDEKSVKNEIEDKLSDLITNVVNQFETKKKTKSNAKIDTENSFVGIQLSEWFGNDDIQNKIMAATETEFVGFTTASKKSIPVSTEAQVKVKNIFNKLPDLTPKRLKEKTADMKIHTEEISMAEMEMEKKVDNLIAKNLNTNNQFGFYTASRKVIQVSTKAKERIEKIFDKLPELSSKKTKDKDKTNVENYVEDLLPNLITDEVDVQLNARPMEAFGFKTASKKCIKVSSADAQAKVENLFTELPEIPKNYPTNSTEWPCNEIDEQIALELTDVQLSEWPLEDAIESEQKIVSKTPLQSAKNISLYRNEMDTHNEKTPVTNKNGSAVTQSSILAIRSPLDNTIKSTIVSRKNLLSLGSNWKQKHRRSMEFATGESSSANPSVKTPLTPNLRDFFDSVPNASTPRQQTNNHAEFNNRRSMFQSLKSCEMTADFEEINWEQSNAHNQNHSPVAKNNSNSCAEASINSQNKSNFNTQERVERISMYGDPPPISPLPPLLHINKKGRVSGLRCSRRLLTKRLM